MSTFTNKSGALGRFEGDLIGQFLPGCPNCQQPHPLARKGHLDPSVCPDCGERLEPLGASFHEPAAVTLGPIVDFFGRLFHQAGHVLRKLAGRIDP